MTVITVRDFTQVFDAYAQFEKNLISSKMESMEETGASEEGMWFCRHWLVCNYMGFVFNRFFFIDIQGTIDKNENMYSVLEYKFKYCPSINLKFIQFCFYFIVNYNITFFFSLLENCLCFEFDFLCTSVLYLYEFDFLFTSFIF